MKQYLKLAQRIIDEGQWVENKRTGTKCLTVINHTLKYGHDGKMPLVTTRKSYWKAAIAELLGYIRGYDNAYDFQKLGTPTWIANANNPAWTSNPNYRGDGDMGKAYRFRELGHCVEVTPKRIEKIFSGEINPNFPKLTPDYYLNTLNMVGKEFKSNNSGKFTVIREVIIEEGKAKHLEIQFSDTGFTKVVSQQNINSGEIKDPYHKSILGIACLGEPKDKDLAKMLRNTWDSIIGRCYDPKNYDTTYHGDLGIQVCDRWLVFANFVEDFTKLYNWELKKVFPTEYTLDKDWCHSNYYSPETCRWSTKKEQSINESSTLTFIATKDGKSHLCKGAKHFVKQLQIGMGAIRKFRNKVSGDSFEHNGWLIEIIDNPNLTYVEVDQLKSIYAKLKLGIDDRRLVMSAHNPHLNEYCALPACMFQHQFSILGDNLYLTSYQRSCDVPLGLNFNMVQCYVFLYIMAELTGLKVGGVTHHIVNAHIYEPQIDLMYHVQLKREPMELPTLKLKRKINTWDDVLTLVPDDFEVIGYESHEPIKYPFTV